MDGGPKVAFDVSVKAIDAGLSANLASLLAGVERRASSRATSPCSPARPGCSATSRTPRPTPTGKWDIAAIPGGGGNWGGSFLTVPKQGKNVDEAYKFIEWLIQPEQQIEIFKKVGNLPSQPGAVQGPGDRWTSRTTFFSNAPVGQIFAKTAENLTPQYLGKKNGPTRVAVENVLNPVQAGDAQAATQAWAEAVKDAEAAARRARPR